MALDTIAQAESTRSFFLAQTLESTKTIPVVSAKLPLDKGADESSDPSQHVISTEPSDSEASGEISTGSGDDPDPAVPAISAESTVIGSFEYRGITYAVEPGGESVAVVAADYAKLPQDFIEAQTIVLPSVVSPDGVDYYSVTRIADGAFAFLTAAAAAAAENGQDADASSDIQAQAEACAYGDQATSEPAEGDGAAPQVISGEVSLSDDPSQHVISSDEAEASDSQAIPTEGNEASSADVVSNEGAEADPSQHVISSDEVEASDSQAIPTEEDEADPNPHVISSGVSEANEVEKSRPSSEREAESIGITAITIPASVTTIEDDAFTGADTLQYVIVSEDNSNYSMYDGCLYDKPLTSLLLIPEGRLGAVRVAPSVTSMDPAVFSHCTVDTIVADPDGAAYQLLEGGDDYPNKNGLNIALASEAPNKMKNRELSYESISMVELKDMLPLNEEGSEDGKVVVSDERGDLSWTEALDDLTACRHPLEVAYCGEGRTAAFSVAANGDDKLVENTNSMLRSAATTTASAGSTFLKVASGYHLAGVSFNAYHVKTPIDSARKVQSLTTFWDSGGAKSSVVRAYPTSAGSYVSGDGWCDLDVIDSATMKITSRPGTWYYEDNRNHPITPGHYGRNTGLSDNISVNIPTAMYWMPDSFTTTWNAAKFGGAVEQTSRDYADTYKNNEVVPNAGTGYDHFPSVRAREGLAFKGWTTDPTGKTGCIPPDNGEAAYETKDDGYTYVTYPETQTVEITDDTTFYAVWTIDVNWNAKNYGGRMADGSDSTTTTVIVNTPATLPDVKDMGEGWTFEGWIPKGATPPASGDPSYIKGTSNIPTITADMAAANTDGAIEGYEGVWSLGIEYKREPGAIDGMTIAGASDGGTGTLAKTGIIYGDTVTAPTVTWPASHHFSHWTASDGTESAPGATEDAPHTIKVTAPGPVVAHWAPNERDVVLNGNGSSTADQTVWSEYDKQMSLFASAGSGDSATKLAVPEREGYEFAGYWNTRYTENATRTEDGVPLTDGGTLNDVAPTQYYGTDAAGQLTSLTTWDITNDAQQLFAHWRYTVRLSMNAVNSDGELVLNDAEDDFAASIVWPDEMATEQKGYTEGATHFTLNQKVQDSASPSATLKGYTFTAIDGAPIQVPKVAGRQGYGDTALWATESGFGGDATGEAFTGVSDPFRPTLQRVIDVDADGTNPEESYALVLYADWGGLAKKYTVRFVTDYENAAGDGFAVSPGERSGQTVEVVYDQPIDASKLFAYATDGSVNYSDATKDASGASRSLVLKGFYRDECAVDGAGEANRVYVDVRDDAFTTATPAGKGIAFREVSADDSPTTPIDLYAWWAYNTMSIAFDLQGGALPSTGGFSDTAFAATIPSVTTQGQVPAISEQLGEGYAKVPQRAGYEFAGYWNTPYNERSAEEAAGVTISPRCYYVASGDNVVVNESADAPGAWLEYANTTLYAHWRYDIAFDKQLTNNDIATLGLEAAPDDTEDELAGATTLLWVTEGGVEHAFDKFGNEYVKVKDNTSGGPGNETATLQVHALAGSPVLLPSVYDRKAYNADAGKYIFAGYNKTERWFTSQSKAAESELARESAASDYTLPGGSWSGSDATGLPVGVGGMDVPEAGTLTLYTDWEDAKQTFYVEILFNYGFNADGTPVGADGPEIDYASQDGVANRKVEIRYDDRFEALGWDSAWKERAQVSGEEETHDNLDFAGAYTKPLDFRTGSTDGAMRYFKADGTSDVPFRFVSEADAVEATRTNNSENYSIKLYARWQEPTREATFNLFDHDDAPASAVSEATLTLQKGTVLSDKVREPEVASALSTLADQVKGEATLDGVRVQRYGAYEFGGFWTTPVAETAAANGGVQPVCYFVLDDVGDTLVPAVPTTGSDGAADGWLTEANTRTSWQEDESTVLYAHWKYRIRFVNEASIPADEGVDQAVDLMEIGGEGKDNAVVEKYLGGGEVDARGRVTFGQSLDLPFDQKGGTNEATHAVKRVRDFSKTPSSYDLAAMGRAYTGHDFIGWSTTGSAGALSADACIDPGTDFAREPSTVVPVNGVATLHANWQAREYTLTFQYSYPAASWAQSKLDVKNGDEVDHSITVAYDQPIAQSVIPYELGGFRFLGYWGGASTGAQYYSGGLSTAGGAAAPTGKAWYVPDPGAAGSVQNLFGRYEQLGYEVTFHSWDEADGRTIQPTAEADAWATTNKATWHYGDRYTDATEGSVDGATGSPLMLDFEPFRSSAATFTRHGYVFAGWYFYEDAAADHETEANRTFIWRAGSDGASGASGLFRYDATSGDWKRDATKQYFDFDWNERPSLDLYAAWTPITYQVSVYPNFQNSNASATGALGTFEFFYEEDLSRNADFQRVIGWNADGTNNLERDGAPFRFAGFNRASLLPSQTSSTADGWLIDGDTDGVMQLPGGRFMPEEAGGAITLHAAWQALSKRNIAVFKGSQAASFRQGQKEVEWLTLSGGYDYDDRVSLANAQWKSVEAKAGYAHLGFVEVPFDLIGVSAPSGDMTEDEVKRFIEDNDLAAKVNGLTIEQLAGLPLVPDPIVPLSGHAFKDYFLVAQYQLKTDAYEIVLDLGDAATYEGEVIDGISTGVTMANAAPFGYVEAADYEKDPTRFDPSRIQRVTKSLNVTTPDFTLPQPSSDEYEFMGWSKVKPTAEDPLPSDRQRTVPIDVERYVAEASVAGGDEAKAKQVYYAVWKEKEYVLRFATGRTQGNLDEGDALAQEDAVWEHVSYSDTITMPYPATRGEGWYFMQWSLREPGSILDRETFASAEDVEMKDLLFAINHSKRYRDEATSVPLKPELVQTTYDANGDPTNTIVIDADWGSTISATMPMVATVNVDLQTGDVLSGKSYLRSNVPNTRLEVVSLRYDRLDADGESDLEASGSGDARSFVFDEGELSGLGDVLLTVYANAKFSDPEFWTEMLRKENVGADGKLIGAAEAQLSPGSANDPLKLSLRESGRVVPKTLVAEGHYMPTGAAAMDGVQTVSEEHGFVPFGNGEANQLPIYYGLLFTGDARPSDFSMLYAMGADSDDAVSVARLYYTVQRVG